MLVLAAAALVPATAQAQATARAQGAAQLAAKGKKKWKPPRGAVKLPASKVKKVGSVVCGQPGLDPGAGWKAGKQLRDRYFITFAQLSRNETAEAKKLLKRAKALRRGAARAAGGRAAKLRRLAGQATAKAKSLRKRTKADAAKSRKLVGRCDSSSSGSQPLRFDLSGASGLAVQSVVSGNSNLDAILPQGQLRDAVASGSVDIQRAIIGPDGTTYVVFAQPTALEGAESQAPHCVLAEIDVATGVPTCVDDSLGQVTWPDSFAGNNPGIQFDASGAIYYAGYPLLSNGVPGMVLRRHDSTGTTSLVSGNVHLSNFLVLPDGRTLITGETSSTLSRWVRVVNPSGSLESLAPIASDFISLFPDGNVYLGFWDTGYFGVYRYLTDSNALEAKAWIASATATPEPYFKSDEFCAGSEGTPKAWFCGTDGAIANPVISTTSGKVYAVAGQVGSGTLVQYYPTVSFPKTIVRRITAAAGAGNRLIISGLDASDHNTTTLYDTTTGTDTELIPPSNEIEIYHLTYAASRNAVLFDGLRFADNRYVLGEVDLATNKLTIFSSEASKWVEVQSYE